MVKLIKSLYVSLFKDSSDLNDALKGSINLRFTDSFCRAISHKIEDLSGVYIDPSTNKFRIV